MKTRIIKIEEGSCGDAWYICSNGCTYYDSMAITDTIQIGDVIDIDDYD